MNWLARLKKTETSPYTEPTKPTKPGFVGFVAPDMAPLQKTGAGPAAANDASPDPDRWCWPHSSAMSGAEIDRFIARAALFTGKGASSEEAEALADKLVTRDREQDDRALCLECTHLGGYGRTSWRCGNWQRADVPLQGLVPNMMLLLQRCNGFSG
jgi:hypothetical protein